MIDPTSPLGDTLRELIDFWRKEATDHDAPCHESDRNYHDMKALCYRTCADDLETALAALVRAVPLGAAQEELDQLRVEVETLRTLLSAWQKRAYEAERTNPHGEMVDPALMEPYYREMREKTIPAIIAAVRDRQRAAAEAPIRILTAASTVALPPAPVEPAARAGVQEPCGDCGLPILDGQETATVCPGTSPSYRVHRRCGKVGTAHGRVVPASPGVEPAAPLDPVAQALEALEFSHGAILDAIGMEDGLDSAAGAKVLGMIRAALTANGRIPPDWPGDDQAVEPRPIWTASVEPAAPRDQQTKENKMETVIYPCGCSATGTLGLPRDCPTHPRLTADELYRVMQAWEGQPASEEQTRIVIKLGALREGAIRAGDSAMVTPLDRPIPAACGAASQEPSVPPLHSDDWYKRKAAEEEGHCVDVGPSEASAAVRPPEQA